MAIDVGSDVASTPGLARDEDSIRREVRSWIAENWDPGLALVEWRTRLADAGWATPSWSPRWYGRGLPAWADELVKEELKRAGAVGLPLGGGMGLAAPTILEHGPDAVRERFLRPILTGEELWCQLFSEPSAGSDLAGLTAHAVEDGDRWIVSGQKVWNTSAHHADFGILIARTNWDVPKHRGLTYFVLPMKQPGVTVRPLRQMNDYSSFNEVFMDDAVIPADHVVGEVGGGWSVALTTLAYERRFGGMTRPAYRPGIGRAVDEAIIEADDHFETYKWYPQRGGRADLVVEHARRNDRLGDPVVRQEIARLHSMQRVAAWTAERARAARALGRPPGAEGSIGKLATSDIARQASKVHSLVAGPDSLLHGPESAFEGLIAEVYVSVPGQSIAGGTDEIQRNILGEKMLGLPREPAPDKDKPYRDVTRNG
jgi:alkylation response protein AidB-like acyl-CoA dehydrogenase